MALRTWLKFDGDTNDSSGDGRNFTNNSVVFADAKIGQGYYNDSGNYARRAYRFDSMYEKQNNFTFAAWINSTGTTTGTHIFYQFAISNNRDCCNQIGWGIGVVNSSGNIVVFTDNFANFTSVNARNKWVHVAVSVSSTQIKTYFNGVLTYTRNIAPFVYNGHPLTIGKMGFYYQGPDGYFAWEGFVDDFRFYDHALTANEVKKLAQAKVTHLKLSGNLNDAAGYVNGTGSISYTTDTIRNKQCRSSGTVTIANGSQAITGDQTIAMWLYPTSLSSRQNPWNKAYGGEGTITQETDGSLSYYWGTNGGNGSPYQGFSSGSGTMVLNTWTHVAIVRDLTNNQLRWYKNGVQVATGIPSYGAAAKTTASTLIGAGYVNNYSGRIADVRQYATALSAAEILKLATVPIYFDADGNIFCHEYETVGVGNNVKFNSKGVIQANAFQEAQNMGSVKQKVDNFVLKMNGRILDL